MSLARTLLEESTIERELNAFLAHLIKRFSLNQTEVFEAMREYREDRNVSPVDEPDVQVTITRKSGRYHTQVAPGLTIENQQLKSLLNRSSLSFEEYNYLKSFLNTANISFSDAPEPVAKTPKLTNVADIVSHVQQEIAESEQLEPTQPQPVRSEPVKAESKKKLKLKKITKQMAWCENTHYVYRLTTDMKGKDKIDCVIGTRPSRDAETQPLTPANISDLEHRGVKYTRT